MSDVSTQRHFLKPNTHLALRPWLAPMNISIMKQVEQRVIKQLLQALMFEQIVDFSSQPAAQMDDRLLTFCIDCHQRSPKVTYLAQGHIHYSFGIIRLSSSDVMRVMTDEDGHEHKQVATLETVIYDILQPIEGAYRREDFIQELRQTLINDIQAISLAGSGTHTDEIEAIGVSGTIEEMSYDELESHLMAGHPYHPCYKSRLGFDLEDNYHYGPEFYQNIDVIWLAVDKSLLCINTVFSDYLHRSNDWIKAYIGEQNYALLMQRLANSLKSTAVTYGLIPVHPWQWQHTLINALQPLLSAQQIICLGSISSIYHAQQSIRTLALMTPDNEADKLRARSKQQSKKDYLKLAMHLTNTSSTRILAKHTVMNAAVITAWLNRLIRDDEVAQSMPIAFLGENMGISLDHEILQDQGYSHPHIYGGLGAIWRENVNNYLSDKQKALPLNGISYIQPNGNKLIDPWLKQYGTDTWIEKLIAVTVPPIMHLLFAHGVALESHAQNIILVHEDGYPIKILLKDLHDGVRYSPDHLAQPELAPTLYRLPTAHAKLNRGSFIETDDTHGIRDMAVACLFFVALADIAIFMQTYYGFAEQRFWQLTANYIKQYQQANPQHQARFELFDVFAKQTRIESLAKRRLFGDEVFPIKFITNPLHDYR